MSKDRLTCRISGDPISQLFVCQSRRLRDAVKRFYDTHCRVVTGDDEVDISADEEDRRLEIEEKTNQANFFTLEMFIEHMDQCVSEECQPSQTTYERHNYMDFINFRDNIYPDLKYNMKPTKLDPLVLWTQIRTHIKGSFEAWKSTALIGGKQYAGFLSEEIYMNFELFPPSRCRLDRDQRREAYEVFTKYQVY